MATAFHRRLDKNDFPWWIIRMAILTWPRRASSCRFVHLSASKKLERSSVMRWIFVRGRDA